VISFALGIPHTPWKPERVESYRRMMQVVSNAPLGVMACDSAGYHYSRTFTDRAANWQWSETMWKWAAETNATHFLSLQDDVIPSPNFWPELRAMVEAYPDDVIGLESVHPECKSAGERRERMISTSDGLVGVGYVMPTPLLWSFLDWRGLLIKGAVESVTEDSLLSTWCLATGSRILHPVPTIIDHDTDIASTYGNDHHTHRRPLVTWREITPGLTAEWWRWGKVRHVGSFYGGRVAMLARRWVRGATDQDWERWREA
jgi:hypothetical protein